VGDLKEKKKEEKSTDIHIKPGLTRQKVPLHASVGNESRSMVPSTISAALF